MMLLPKPVRSLLPVCLGALAMCPVVVPAQLILSHVGSADPVTEGWTLTTPTAGTVGAVTNDLGAGIAAWNVTDSSTANGYLYYHIPSSAEIAQGFAQGWTMTVTMRLTGAAPSNGFIGFGYEDGVNAWNVYPEQNAANDFVVTVFGGPTIVLTGQGNAYHTVGWVYNAGTATASLFVDGVERISNYGGSSYTGIEVFFGGGGSTSIGSANYSAVQFTAVPEPSVVSLLAVGLLALAGGVSRRRPTPRSPRGFPAGAGER